MTDRVTTPPAAQPAAAQPAAVTPESQPPATQPAATVPPVTDIPADPNAEENAGPDYSSMTKTDESIHISADQLAQIYVGSAKGNQYKTKPLADMMPSHLYRATSALAQPALATFRWVLDMFLHRTMGDYHANHQLLDQQWFINAPAHLKLEAAMELARVTPDFRPYALMTFSLMAKSSKAKGAPDITAKANPYADVIPADNPEFRQKLVNDMVCSLRLDYPTSPYSTFGRGMHPPSADATREFINTSRDANYSDGVDCGVEIRSAVEAGLRLWRGVSARKVGQEHVELLPVGKRAFDPEKPLSDSNIQIMTGEGIHRAQVDETNLYLDIIKAFQALVGDPRYASYMQTLMAPPVDENQVPVYDDVYHANVGKALSRLPRWSWAWGDSATELTRWEFAPDPKPLTTAASSIMRTFQAIGLFANTTQPEDFIDGVAVPKSMVSKVDPLIVNPEGSMPHNYAQAKAQLALSLKDHAEQHSKSKKLLPAHETVLKATATPESRHEYVEALANADNRADMEEVVAEIEHRGQVLREAMLLSAERAIDENISQVMGSICSTQDPVTALATLDAHVRAVHQPNLEASVS